MQLRRAFALVPFVVCAVASAQQNFDFTINQATSDFTWSGTSTLGNIVGNPSNAFEFAGNTVMKLTPSGSDAISTGEFVGQGDAHAVPDLHGKIAHTPPFPTLATIDVTNLHLKVTAPTFAIAANGAFTASIVLEALSGTLTVDPLIGTTSVTDITGNQSTPTALNGTLIQTGTNLHLTAPVNVTFPFTDPGTGASGTINVVGTLHADWNCPPAATYCTAKTNSLGCVPAITTAGLASYTNGAPFTIGATNVLNQKSGLLFYGDTASATPFQGGIKCVAAPTKRSVIQSSGGSTVGNDCTGTFAFDFNALIQSYTDSSLVPGEEIFTQYWSRDPASPSTTNLTNGARFTICP